MLNKIAKKTFGGILAVIDPIIALKNHGINSEEFYSSVGSATGSILAGGAAGAAIGSFFPGIGNLVGFAIGVAASAIGSMAGEYLGKDVYGRTHNLKEEDNVSNKKDNNDNNANKDKNDNNDYLTGEGETGGIEFEIPNEIKGFRNLLFFDKLAHQNIIFKNEFWNINEILDVANRFLINKNHKFTSINQVFQTILLEIYGGFIGEGVLPYVSLNFNNKALLYSIMPNYYKKTLIGNILGYLDYYLKGFVNGGFFKEDFVNQWYINKNQNFNYLNSNFVNLKKYIYIINRKLRIMNYI